MFWKWTTLALFLALILLGSFEISNHIKIAKFRNFPKTHIGEFSNELSLTPAQKVHCKELMSKYKSHRRESVKKLMELHKQLDTYTWEFADKEKTKQISHEITLIEQSDRDKLIDLFFEFNSSLDKTQQAKLRSKFADKGFCTRQKSFPPKPMLNQTHFKNNIKLNGEKK